MKTKPLRPVVFSGITHQRRWTWTDWYRRSVQKHTQAMFADVSYGMNSRAQKYALWFARARLGLKIEDTDVIDIGYAALGRDWGRARWVRIYRMGEEQLLAVQGGGHRYTKTEIANFEIPHWDYEPTVTEHHDDLPLAA